MFVAYLGNGWGRLGVVIVSYLEWIRSRISDGNDGMRGGVALCILGVGA